jgi:hypothetical protein
MVARHNPLELWAPVNYPSISQLMIELQELTYLEQLSADDNNQDTTSNNIVNPATPLATPWAPLSYPDMADFIDEIQDCTNHFSAQDQLLIDEDINPCPSPPPPPLPPPPMNPPPLPGVPASPVLMPVRIQPYRDPRTPPIIVQLPPPHSDTPQALICTCIGTCTCIPILVPSRIHQFIASRPQPFLE